ncbi:MAG: Fe-S cluster assembly ATPase SufC [Candidatus Shikimatogenerans sp. Tduv]|uniref:Fe-S cluster assembly ATPase SufC n=1 Tax=Candidatus Shikimatogenerans sp. Tduv TaxID=3158567 RepID=A0AAU7QRU2_9FLAO
MLKIYKLFVKIKNKYILKNINLNIKNKEIHIIMGANGSGKSTLSEIIIGNKKKNIKKGKIYFNKKNIIKKSILEHVNLGFFLSLQNPIEIHGVKLIHFIKTFMECKYINLNKKINYNKILKKIYFYIKKLKLNKNILFKYLNSEFSGGEKKKIEILQLLLLKPNFCILDEIDSGLDIDSMKNIFKIINSFFLKKKKISIIIITHNINIINFIKPNFIHIMYKGKILKSTNNIKNILKIIDKYGYNKNKII